MTAIPTKIGMILLTIYWLSMLGLVVYKVQHNAPVAQLVEQVTCNNQVAGSNPVGGLVI